MMDQELKRKWVEALRSGKYQQCDTYLHRANGTYCCLGVLCDISGAKWALTTVTDEPAYACGMGAETLYYPEHFGLTHCEHETLYMMNDGADYPTAKRLGIDPRFYTFAEIADWIEANL